MQMLHQDEVEKLRAEKQELGKELQESEKAAFKDFCKTAKIKSVSEFEALLYGNSENKEQALL
jgi:hypothetical protein